MTALYIVIAAAGFLLLTASVARELLFRRPATALRTRAPSGESPPDAAELLECQADLLNLLLRLGDETCHLIHRPLEGEHQDGPADNGSGGDRATIASVWKDLSRDWQNDWDLINARCGFSELADQNLGVAYDRMAQVHSDLPSMRLKYQSLLVRFDDEQAAELARMRHALDQSGTALRKRLGDPD